MANLEELVAPSDRLLGLIERLESVDGFNEMLASLRAGHSATLDGVWGSSCALAAATLARHAPGTLVVVAPHPSDIDTLVDDLRLFTTASIARFLPSDSKPGDRSFDGIFGERLQHLKTLLRADRPKVVATSIQALLQPVPERELVECQTRHFRVGDQVPVDELLKWLVLHRYQSISAVQLPGEFALHGGILDIFAPDWDAPVRVELFDNQIESLRRFDVATQRSLTAVERIELTALDSTAEHTGHFADYLAPDSWFVLVEPSELDEAGRSFLNRLDHPPHYHTTAAVLKRVFQFPSITAEAVAAGSLETTCHLKVESVERFSGEVHRVRDELEAIGHDQEVFLVCQTEAEVQRLQDIFGNTTLAAAGRLHFPLGHLAQGFRLVPARTVVLSSNEVFHRADVHRTAQRQLGRIIDNFLDLRENDLVVHVSHGIARYKGLKLLEKEDQVEEHLELEFQGGTKLYVPVSRIELVQKYVGGSKARPVLAKIGGRTWLRHKKLAEDAVVDLAQDMLALQARRNSRPGIVFPSDTEWQVEFDAAFPYQETADQLEAIACVKREMQLARPMDRLICGDVGYGKTEVAMRAAFKAIDAGYQVAVLVPTTILAEQHRRTFSGRMAEFPFNIAALSRFLTRKQQQQVLDGLRTGAVDVVIGTHRLVQPDVQFQNLGLIIIDEEQRFGVEVKERLKALREVVDVMTLTATPIPRTLHMSLLGLRDISNLVTPPEERLSVETRVTRFDADLIRQAVLRELNRDGQIFFVHNRIHDIQALARRLSQIVPEARIGVGHGQMPEGELEQVMYDFVNHKFDLLLATTIVESGLDIPNANTIFIDQADRYGLADLHQLRGRVGRYKHRAYCYLLVDPNQSLNPLAAKRLKAIEEFSDIGAGFAIAMRDLEIRGAGNILGTQQSGHIAAVGYELYCELLEKAVRHLKHLPPKQTIEVNVALPGQAFLPRSYVPDIRAKIDLYRRIARVGQLSELDDLASEMVDRFGPLPQPVQRLLALMEVRLLSHSWQIESIHLDEQYLVFGYTSRKRAKELVQASGGLLRIVDDKSLYFPLGSQAHGPDELLATVKALLRAGERQHYNPAPRALS
jgi:transcription-repair coupling factor (superfamily II helicase)